ncbi:unnamed protein product [Laminaria digitata]
MGGSVSESWGRGLPSTIVPVRAMDLVVSDRIEGFVRLVQSLTQTVPLVSPPLYVVLKKQHLQSRHPSSYIRIPAADYIFLPYVGVRNVVDQSRRSAGVND